MRENTRVYENVELSRYTTLGIGGKAARLCIADDLDGVEKELFRGAKTFVLGGGSKLLVSDAGFDGTVLKPALTQLYREGNRIVAGSGVRLPVLAAFAAREGLSGLEWAVGIPGTVGGALKMNAGAHGGDIAGVLSYADVYAHGKTKRRIAEECGFSYRQSNIDGIVLRAAFYLRTGDRAAIASATETFMSVRRKAQPQGRSAGSVFKSVNGVPAWKYVEGAGLKGLKIGGARISEKHANFIVNTGGASAADVYKLILKAEKEVYEKYGVVLEREIILVGEF